MLREILNVSQIPGEPLRRWFRDDYFDLIVWFDPQGEIFGFQLCYDTKRHPRALTWLRDRGFTHEGIDDGDDPLIGYKSTPILIPDGPFETREIQRRFTEACTGLPEDITRLVLEKIQSFSVDEHGRNVS
ncbi:MAG: hypothetical protein AB1512_22970 [Thermodesulfobacteriota bacterium]